MKYSKPLKNTLLISLTIALGWLLFYLEGDWHYFYLDYNYVAAISLLFQFFFIPLVLIKHIRERVKKSTENIDKSIILVSLLYIFAFIRLFVLEFIDKLYYIYNFTEIFEVILDLTIHSWPIILITIFLVLYIKDNNLIKSINNKFMKKFLSKIFFTPLNKTESETQEGSVVYKPRKRSYFSKLMRGIAFTIFIIASLIVINNWLDDDYYYEDDYYSSDKRAVSECNIAGVFIWGDIVTFESDGEYIETSSDEIIYIFDEINKDDAVNAVLIEIDSIGGYPVAAEEMAEAIKRSNKPTVALIRESGNSAAYWVASAADTLFASRNSDLASIGVDASFLNYSEQNRREGIEFIEISSGKFKATGSPDKPLSEEERELMMRDTNILHQNFIEAVAENRDMDIEKVRELADGSTMLGQMALENGLIDKVGTIYDAREYLEELIDEEIDVCWY